MTTREKITLNEIPEYLHQSEQYKFLLENTADSDELLPLDLNRIKETSEVNNIDDFIHLFITCNYFGMDYPDSLYNFVNTNPSNKAKVLSYLYADFDNLATKILIDYIVESVQFDALIEYHKSDSDARLTEVNNNRVVLSIRNGHFIKTFTLNDDHLAGIFKIVVLWELFIEELESFDIDKVLLLTFDNKTYLQYTKSTNKLKILDNFYDIVFDNVNIDNLIRRSRNVVLKLKFLIDEFERKYGHHDVLYRDVETIKDIEKFKTEQRRIIKDRIMFGPPAPNWEDGSDEYSDVHSDEEFTEHPNLDQLQQFGYIQQFNQPTPLHQILHSFPSQSVHQPLHSFPSQSVQAFGTPHQVLQNGSPPQTVQSPQEFQGFQSQLDSQSQSVPPRSQSVQAFGTSHQVLRNESPPQTVQAFGTPHQVLQNGSQSQHGFQGFQAQLDSQSQSIPPQSTFHQSRSQTVQAFGTPHRVLRNESPPQEFQGFQAQLAPQPTFHQPLHSFPSQTTFHHHPTVQAFGTPHQVLRNGSQTVSTQSFPSQTTFHQPQTVQAFGTPHRVLQNGSPPQSVQAFGTSHQTLQNEFPSRR